MRWPTPHSRCELVECARKDATDVRSDDLYFRTHYLALPNKLPDPIYLVRRNNYTDFHDFPVNQTKEYVCHLLKI